MWGNKNRAYTGFERVSKGKRLGAERLKDWIIYLSSGKLRNVGGWNVRVMRAFAKMSVHATGRAMDIRYQNREDGLVLADFLVRHAEWLGVELVTDYVFGKFGRSWRCDRNAWKVYTKPTVGTGGSWLHIEISNVNADNPKWFDEVFRSLLLPVLPENHPTN